MKKPLACITVAVLALNTMAAAQPTEAPEKPDQEQSQKDDKQKTKKPTIFKPSEELSEDYSVPFPTDI